MKNEEPQDPLNPRNPTTCFAEH